MRPMSRRRAIALASLVVGVAACGGSPSASRAPASPSAAPDVSASAGAVALVWPAPPDPMERTVQAGLKPQPKEFKTNHVHAHLDVFVDGKPVSVPAGIGIKIDDPAVTQFPDPAGTVAYSPTQLCNEPCISPLHTHDATGIIHTESGDPRPNKLGELFTEWGVTLDTSCVATFCSPATKIAIYIDGEPTTGDPRAIELRDLREIAIVIGTPPSDIPKTADFSNA